MSNSFQNSKLSLSTAGTASIAFAVIIHNGDAFLFKSKRETGDEGQTFPKLIVAGLRSQGEKEKDCSGHLSTIKKQLPRVELKYGQAP